jgi:hypothetical protein
VGDDDQLGTLNLLTDERTQRAAALVGRGAVFPLNLPLHQPQPHLAWRTPPTHHILHVGHEARGIQPGGADDPSTGLIDRDDYVDGLWLQAGSQGDSLSHVRHRQHGNYNGIADQEIHGGPGTKLGTDQWALRAIVGRGVLVDMARHLARIGHGYDPNSAFEVTVDDLEGTLAALQGERHRRSTAVADRRLDGLTAQHFAPSSVVSGEGSPDGDGEEVGDVGRHRGRGPGENAGPGRRRRAATAGGAGPGGPGRWAGDAGRVREAGAAGGGLWAGGAGLRLLDAGRV